MDYKNEMRKLIDIVKQQSFEATLADTMDDLLTLTTATKDLSDRINTRVAKSLNANDNDAIIEGSTYFDKYPIQANRTLHLLKSQNKYRRYFTNRGKVELLGFENFHYLCENGGSRYTNEYQYATVLSDFVSDEVVGKSVKLLKAYGLNVF